MNKHYNVIKDEFEIKKYISHSRLKSYIRKEIKIEELNFHEKSILKNNKSYTLLPYNTKNLYDLISYYIVEFDKNIIIDIIEIRVLEDLSYVTNNKYIKTGFKFLNAITMKDDKDKNNQTNIAIKKMIDKYLEKYEGLDDTENFDHPDSIIQIIKDNEEDLFINLN